MSILVLFPHHSNSSHTHNMEDGVHINNIHMDNEQQSPWLPILYFIDNVLINALPLYHIPSQVGKSCDALSYSHKCSHE